MKAQTRKMIVGAAIFTAVFYAARKGFLGMEIQQYAIDISTKAVVDGVKF